MSSDLQIKFQISIFFKMKSAHLPNTAVNYYSKWVARGGNWRLIRPGNAGGVNLVLINVCEYHSAVLYCYTSGVCKQKYKNKMFKGVLHLWALFLKTIDHCCEVTVKNVRKSIFSMF